MKFLASTLYAYRTFAVALLFLLVSRPDCLALEPGVTTLVSTGACWRFHDRGADLSTNWVYSGTEDSAWSLGFAELGYGDGDEATTLNFGPDPSNKYITTYFRHEFVVPSPTAFTSLRLRAKFDDGLVVYLNGSEVYRNDLAFGQNYLSLASAESDDDTNYLTVYISPSQLVPDRNILAAEMHLAAPSDPDISYDLELVGLYATNAPSPLLTVAKAAGTQFVTSWLTSVGSNFVLQASTTLRPTSWITVSNPVVVAGSRYNVTNVLTPSAKFFRLYSATANTVPCQPPLALMQPLEIFAAIGTNLSLSVTVTGTPPITYQWFHNTFPVAGATTPTLTLTNLQRTNGGRYDLCMAGPCDTGFSYPISVTVGGVDGAMTDDFAGRPVFTDLSADINSSNQLASAEAGEPAILGHPAERSVWLSYQAPDDGVVTFTTAGSTFDTLLAAYHGTDVSALDLIDADDDHGLAYTSMISFAVTNGESVEVKVDNYPGSAGDFQLGWTLVPTNAVVPLILVQPVSQLVAISNNFTVSVVATNPGSFVPLTYQWRHNGTNVAGATNAALTVINAQAPATGLYDVLVSNGTYAKTSQTANITLSVGTGQLITVTSASKKTKCSTYFYAGDYTNSADANGYFQIVEPLQLLTWSNQNKTSVVNYPAWAYRQTVPLNALCTATRTSIFTTGGGPFNYRFQILIATPPTTFYVEYGPYP